MPQEQKGLTMKGGDGRVSHSHMGLCRRNEMQGVWSATDKTGPIISLQSDGLLRG